ncbi:unnamed protein product, partial [Medioppia subpectinata]
HFTGSVVVVTGSSSGIGEGIVKLFSILGANVVVTGRKAQDVQRVAKEVQELSPLKLKPLEVVGDLTKTSDVNNLINSTVQTFGRLDVLVNNAGIYPESHINQTDLLSVWDQIFAVDLRAVVELIHQSVPHLEKTNGTIIDISSIAAIAPMKSLAYASAKAGLDMLTKILALELGPKNIRVNTINPGVTHVRDPIQPFEEYAPKVTPLGRVGQPLDIARAVAFLASTDANFITGANVVVDGGLVYNADYPIEDYKAVAKSRDFTGKVILVTGSSSGIGEGIVKLKAQDVQRVAKEVQELSPLKLKPLEVVGDLTKTSDVNNLIDSTVKTFGKIDVLVNNAGIYPQTNITQTDILSVWDQIFALNLRAVVELIHRSVPHLEKTNGTIIDISSIGAIAPFKVNLAYASAKA